MFLFLNLKSVQIVKELNQRMNRTIPQFALSLMPINGAADDTCRSRLSYQFLWIIITTNIFYFFPLSCCSNFLVSCHFYRLFDFINSHSIRFSKPFFKILFFSATLVIYLFHLYTSIKFHDIVKISFPMH